MPGYSYLGRIARRAVSASASLPPFRRKRETPEKAPERNSAAPETRKTKGARETEAAAKEAGAEKRGAKQRGEYAEAARDAQGRESSLSLLSPSFPSLPVPVGAETSSAAGERQEDLSAAARISALPSQSSASAQEAAALLPALETEFVAPAPDNAARIKKAQGKIVPPEAESSFLPAPEVPGAAALVPTGKQAGTAPAPRPAPEDFFKAFPAPERGAGEQGETQKSASARRQAENRIAEKRERETETFPAGFAFGPASETPAALTDADLFAADLPPDRTASPLRPAPPIKELFGANAPRPSQKDEREQDGHAALENESRPDRRSLLMPSPRQSRPTETAPYNTVKSVSSVRIDSIEIQIAPAALASVFAPAPQDLTPLTPAADGALAAEFTAFYGLRQG